MAVVQLCILPARILAVIMVAWIQTSPNMVVVRPGILLARILAEIMNARSKARVIMAMAWMDIV
jgi:hypothetical protein